MTKNSVKERDEYTAARNITSVEAADFMWPCEITAEYFFVGISSYHVENLISDAWSLESRLKLRFSCSQLIISVIKWINRTKYIKMTLWLQGWSTDDFKTCRQCDDNITVSHEHAALHTLQRWHPPPSATHCVLLEVDLPRDSTNKQEPRGDNGGSVTA